MNRIDRLSALIARFEVTVTLVGPGQGNLLVFGTQVTRTPSHIAFAPRGARPVIDTALGDSEVVLIEAAAGLGGAANPLLGALPERMSLQVQNDRELDLLARLLLAEADAQRCGVNSVLSRLGEVLIIRLLRAEIGRGALSPGEVPPGLLAGLADPRISRAVVAIHEAPERDWRNDDLAGEAGLSLSHFCELFQTLLGVTPQVYLRRWRMTLSHQDIERGAMIKAVSRRYGYGSSEAFAKAYTRHFGTTPIATRIASRGATPKARSTTG